MANADRGLPFDHNSLRLLLSSTGPKNPSEFQRVLAPEGALLLVVPAPDDLIELRTALLGAGRRDDRAGRALEVFAGRFDCVARSEARARRTLDRAEIEDLLAATYRGGRQSERARLARVDALETTFAAEVLHMVPRAARRA